MLSALDAELVRCDGDLPGLAVLLDGDAFAELLARELPALGATAATLRYVRYKPRTNCLCLFRIVSANGSFEVYGKAFAPGHPGKLRHWRGESAQGGSDNARRAVSERWHIGISCFPDDQRLNALARLHDDPTRERVLAEAFERFPEWRSSAIATVRYKPERRYVAALVHDGAPAAALKIYERRDYEDARAGAHLFASRDALRVPSCVGESPADRMLGFEWIQGCGLSEQIGRSSDAVQLTGLALAELHGQDAPRSLAFEQGTVGCAVRAAADGVAAIYPQLADRAISLAGRIVSVLDEDRESARPSHGDFYAKQVIVTSLAAAIVDFDRATLAHPAADLGTFAAQLRLGVLRGISSRAEADSALESLIEGYGHTRPVPSRVQRAAYTAAALLRLAPEPFRHCEPNPLAATEALIDEAAMALNPVARPSARHAPISRNDRRIGIDDPFGVARDPAWSFLRDAFDPSEARRRLEAPLARLGAPDGCLRRIGVTRLKPGRRCVVEYGLEIDASPGEARSPGILGKARIKGLSVAAHCALGALWNAGFNPSRSLICVPQPLGAIPEWRMTLQQKVPGVASSERLGPSDGAPVAARIAEAIYDLHTRATPPAHRHTLADELRILRERLLRVAPLVGARRIERLLQHCEALAARLPRVSARAIHRDFYPAHVLIDGDRLWLIDFDLYAAGDPALDVGNFLAHMIEERVRRDGCIEGPSEVEDALASRYAQLAGPRVVPAIRAYTTLSLARHVYLSTQFSERNHATEALLDTCERQLSAGFESRAHA